MTNEFYEHLDKINNKEKALSYSPLSALLKSPSHYYRYVMEKETTEAMEKGKRFHMAILEPEKYKETYYIFDDTEKVNELLTNGYIDEKGKHITVSSPRSTTVYKNWKIEELKKYAGKEEISLDEHTMYMKMIQKLSEHSVCKDLLFGEGGENEVKFEYDDIFKISGVIDRKTPTYTLDLKKVKDAAYARVKWDIEQMNYDLQCAIYSKANKTKKHYLVFIDEGCNITVVEVIRETIERYMEKYLFALEAFQRCMETDSWNMSYDFYQPLVRI